MTFKPDLAKFGMTELEADTVALMRKRVYDMAGILGKGVKVHAAALDMKLFRGGRASVRVNGVWEPLLCIGVCTSIWHHGVIWNKFLFS